MSSFQICCFSWFTIANCMLLLRWLIWISRGSTIWINWHWSLCSLHHQVPEPLLCTFLLCFSDFCSLCFTHSEPQLFPHLDILVTTIILLSPCGIYVYSPDDYTSHPITVTLLITISIFILLTTIRSSTCWHHVQSSIIMLIHGMVYDFESLLVTQELKTFNFLGV